MPHNLIWNYEHLRNCLFPDVINLQLREPNCLHGANTPCSLGLRVVFSAVSPIRRVPNLLINVLSDPRTAKVAPHL